MYRGRTRLKSIVILFIILIMTTLALATSPINAIKMNMLTNGQFQTFMKVKPKVSHDPTSSLKVGGTQYDISPYHFQANGFVASSFNVYKILFFYYASPASDPT